MDVDELNPRLVIGLFVVLGLLEGTSIVTSVMQQRRWKREQEEQARDKKAREEERARLEQERIRKIRERVLGFTWIPKVTDFILNTEGLIKRIEIWENQLIVETEKFNIYPLGKFGAEGTLTQEETYHANKILFEKICENGGRRYYINDRDRYCEILKYG